MPIELKKKTADRADETAPEAKGLALFNEDGELTLPGEFIASFLDTCDFTPVVESETARPYLVLAEEGEEETEGEAGAEGAESGEAESGEAADDESEGEEGEDEAATDEAVEVLLPGIVAARLVDEADLVEMFGFYLDRAEADLDESDEAALQDRAALACFRDVRGEEGIADESAEAVAEMLRSVIAEGMVAAEVSEKFLTKGARLKVARIRKKPKTGAKKRELKKRRREEGRGAKKAKIGRQKKAFKRKRASRLKMLARESADEAVLLFGFGEGIDGANFRVAVSESPSFEFDEDTSAIIVTQCGEGHFDDLDEKSKVPPQFLSKKKGKKKDDEDDDNKDEKGKKNESVDESTDAEPKQSLTSGPFAVSPGRPSLDEGAGLAASALATLGVGKKALSEDED